MKMSGATFLKTAAGASLFIAVMWFAPFFIDQALNRPGE